MKELVYINSYLIWVFLSSMIKGGETWQHYFIGAVIAGLHIFAYKRSCKFD